MSVTVAPLTGAALEAALDDVARLRIAVFRAFPYLYDGDMDYERRYLAGFAESPGAVIVAARDGARIVGAATGAPMADHADAFGAAFGGSGYPIGEVFYCAESVLLPEYRGQGLGHAFFDRREVRARELGLRYAAFCAVVRPADHPARPDGYRPLDGFWRKRGYRPAEGIVAEFPWRDRGDDAETTKPLQFWIRAL